MKIKVDAKEISVELFPEFLLASKVLKIRQDTRKMHFSIKER